MSKFQHFELSEFFESSEAERRGIDNTPTFDIVDHIEELCDKILQPLRIAWGSGLRITSGYRCPALNKAVGGQPTSAHVSGYAADVQPINCKMDEFYVFAEEWLRTHDIAFDQAIREKKGTTRWWHIGIRNQSGQQRRQFLTINK